MFPNCDICGRFHKCEPGSAWRETGGFIAWHPPSIRAFMRNAKEIGL